MLLLRSRRKISISYPGKTALDYHILKKSPRGMGVIILLQLYKDFCMFLCVYVVEVAISIKLIKLQVIILKMGCVGPIGIPRRHPTVFKNFNIF